MSEVVLDASAVLALLGGETGQEEVAAVLPEASVSAVNLAEVLSKLCERGMPAGEANEAVLALGVEVVAFSAEQAAAVGRLRPLTKAAGLSLGDRACLALAQERATVAMTAERRWDNAVATAAGVTIRRIRNSA